MPALLLLASPAGPSSVLQEGLDERREQESLLHHHKRAANSVITEYCRSESQASDGESGSLTHSPVVSAGLPTD